MAPTDRELDLVLAELERVRERQEKQGEALDNIMERLAAAQGGAMVLRWLGFGSLGGVLAALATFYVWLRSTAH